MPEPSCDSPDQSLRQALLWAEQPGVPSTLCGLRSAVQAGASLDAPFEDGFTPLTYAIDTGMGSPKAVALLLELGADPSRRDAHGWTPWGRCQDKREIPSMASRMDKISEMLEKAGADRSDAWVFRMRKAVVSGDRSTIELLVGQGVDLNSRLLAPLHLAVLEGNLDLVRFLLTLGAHPDGPDPQYTCLMSAVQHNQPEIIRLLLDAGADPNALWQGLEDHSLIHLARLNGHNELARWLARLFPRMPGADKAKPKSLNPKLRPVLKAGTNGVNHGQGNEDILRTLDRWDLLHGIEITQVDASGVTVRFLSLPESLDRLAAEIAGFCPDLVEQGFGATGEMIAMAEAEGAEVPSDVRRLVEGVDLDQPDAGLRLLARSLRETGVVALWWD